MTTYYVRKTGNDSNDGLSAGNALLTIGAAVGKINTSGGDTIWIGAGRYDESVVLPLAGSTAETKILGDVTGEQTGDAGMVLWTAWTGAAHGSYCISTTGGTSNPADLITLEDIRFYCGDLNGIDADDVIGLTVRRCIFEGGGDGGAYAISTFQGTEAVAAWTLEDCVFACTAANAPAVHLTCYSDTTPLNQASVIQGCTFIGGGGSAESSAALVIRGLGTGTSTGVSVLSCTFITGEGQLGVDGSAWEAGGVVVRGCLFTSGVRALDADSTTPIDEDWNVLASQIPRSNVTAGSNSVVSDGGVFPLHTLESHIWGLPVKRPLGEPLAESDAIDYVNEGVVSMPTSDAFGRPRPLAGALLTAGAVERANGATQETSTTQAGSSALKMTGPGVQDFEVPVAASSTTLSVYVRRDSGTYTLGTRPSISVLNGGAAGVSDATATGTAACDDAWEQLSLTFTPTSSGIVTLRLRSATTASAGAAYFDTFSVS